LSRHKSLDACAILLLASVSAALLTFTIPFIINLLLVESSAPTSESESASEFEFDSPEIDESTSSICFALLKALLGEDVIHLLILLLFLNRRVSSGVRSFLRSLSETEDDDDDDDNCDDDDADDDDDDD